MKINGESREIKQIIGKLEKVFPLYTKEIAILLVIMFFLLMIQTFSQEQPRIIERLYKPPYFEGDTSMVLYYDNEELNLDNESMTINLEANSLEKSEMIMYLEEVSKRTKEEFRLQYDGFKKITGPIELKNRMYGCNITYDIKSEGLMNRNGWIDYTLWKEEKPMEIEYTTELKGESLSDVMQIQIPISGFTLEYKKKYNEYLLQKTISELNSDEKVVVIELPKDMTFYNSNNGSTWIRFIYIWCGLIVICMMMSHFEKRLICQQENKKRMIHLTYFISSFSLLYQTGLTIQKSFAMALYNRCQTMEKNEPLYLELIEIEGMVHSECKFADVLKRFEEVFHRTESKRFIRIVMQNLIQGDEYLVDQLGYLTKTMWDDRIRSARKESEKASSKLVFPMLLIFIVILLISIVPTFLQVKTIF